MKLEDLKVGDAVALPRYAGWSGRIDLTKGEVERVTKTQIVALGGRRFKKRDGIEVGRKQYGYNSAPRLRPVTPELLEEERQDRLEEAAERKCREWAKKLERARGEDALRLADMLPEVPE